MGRWNGRPRGRGCAGMDVRAADQRRSVTRLADGGGTSQNIRYSKLAQIDRTNVNRLERTYDAMDGPGGLQTQPIVVDGVLYANTPKHRVIALDAETGALLWKFDSGLDASGGNRGVTCWSSGSDRRIFAGVDRYVYALDAKSEPIPSFGDDGRIDLHRNLGRDPDEQSVRLTTPGVVYRDPLIVGGRVSESLPHRRVTFAHDARTGELRWTFHTIPRPGEFGFDTWPGEAWRYIGGANNWAGMALDEDRGIVYVPTGSAAADFYGANRLGDNLFANTLLALDASTGKRLWHFQAVRHDILDRDFPAPPNLVTVTRDGRRIDAVAQTSKQGHVFLFDRVTGTPLFLFSTGPLRRARSMERSRPTHSRFPSGRRLFARQMFTQDILTRRTGGARGGFE